MQRQPTTEDLVENEIEWRLDVVADLSRIHGNSVPPTLLKENRIYRGQRGIYADALRTRGLTGGISAVTVSVLHTGKSYADDLSPDGLLYHYPRTQNQGKDRAEVAATKAASSLGLPVVAILPGEGSDRSLRAGRVEGWDDEAELFLISFPEEWLAGDDIGGEDSEEPFDLFEAINAPRRSVAARPGQQRFKFRGFQRYGGKCAVCDVSIPQLLDAAHLVPVASSGPSDPRNGLVLCALHHRAMDALLFAFDPGGQVVTGRNALPDMGITCRSLEHLQAQPSPESLQWVWERWQGQ